MSEKLSLPWYKQLTGYHWFVLIVASAAWFFDCLDQRLFSLARIPALTNLMKGEVPLDPQEASKAVQAFGKVVTAWFLIGWGVGGMIFGALGDRYGRARMLTLTILIYSAFTGLSYFSHGKWDFTVFRFLTGLGVGGVFGLAVALIAETVPSGARAQSLGLLQLLSTIGNITAGFSKMAIDKLESVGTIAAGQGWRWMFVIGAIPAVLIIFTRGYLKEPAPWLKLKEEGLLPKGSIFTPYARLWSAKRWRKNLLVGALIASTGVVGLWAIGEYAVDLQNAVFKAHYEKVAKAGGGDDKLKAAYGTLQTATTALAAAPEADKPNAEKEVKTAQAAFDKTVKGEVGDSISWAYLWNMLGAAVGMWLFTRFANASGRRIAFVVGFSFALVATALIYWKMETPTDAYWMMPIMGAAQLGVFAGFAIYLPELFPSSLRSTGTSFCYNLGRFAAAAGSFYSAILTKDVFGGFTAPLPLRYSAMVMCSIFLVGLITVAFAPETKGQPLPEDEPLKA